MLFYHTVHTQHTGLEVGKRNSLSSFNFPPFPLHLVPVLGSLPPNLPRGSRQQSRQQCKLPSGFSYSLSDKVSGAFLVENHAPCDSALCRKIQWNRVMVIVWRLRGNIIRTALCWIVWQCSQSAAHLCQQFLQVKQTGFVTLGPLRCV